VDPDSGGLTGDGGAISSVDLTMRLLSNPTRSACFRVLSGNFPFATCNLQLDPARVRFGFFVAISFQGVNQRYRGARTLRIGNWQGCQKQEERNVSVGSFAEVDQHKLDVSLAPKSGLTMVVARYQLSASSGLVQSRKDARKTGASVRGRLTFELQKGSETGTVVDCILGNYSDLGRRIASRPR
jgi:hypothetical protein